MQELQTLFICEHHQFGYHYFKITKPAIHAGLTQYITLVKVENLDKGIEIVNP